MGETQSPRPGHRVSGTCDIYICDIYSNINQSGFMYGYVYIIIYIQYMFLLFFNGQPAAHDFGQG